LGWLESYRKQIKQKNPAIIDLWMPEYDEKIQDLKQAIKIYEEGI